MWPSPGPKEELTLVGGGGGPRAPKTLPLEAMSIPAGTTPAAGEFPKHVSPRHLVSAGLSTSEGVASSLHIPHVQGPQLKKPIQELPEEEPST